MRVIRVSRQEFDLIIWKAFGNVGAKSEAELETATRTVKKLKDASSEVPLTSEERAQGFQVPGRSLSEEEIEFTFEEDEYNLVKNKLVEFLPNVALVLADVFHDLLVRFKDAESQEAQVVGISEDD